MEDLELTKKDVHGRFNSVLRSVQYCQLERTLEDMKGRGCVSKIGYNSGKFGWNWSAWELYGDDGETVVLVTGHRNLTGKAVNKATCDTLEKNHYKMTVADILKALRA